MRIVFGDLWTYRTGAYVGITTNGTVNAQGLNIMGKGCAKEFKERFPLAPNVVGDLIQKKGNRVHIIHGWNVFTFPTKHDWREKSDIDLIRRSSEQLARMADFADDETFVLPRPGVGAGGLSWEEVLPVIENILPDNVHVITWKDE